MCGRQDSRAVFYITNRDANYIYLLHVFLIPFFFCLELNRLNNVVVVGIYGYVRDN